MDFKDTLFIFTTSPAGLGHIRVMNAIKSARPQSINSVDLGILDLKANRIHDLGSRVKFFVKLTEFYQTNPIAEKFVTHFYTNYLKKHTKNIIKDFTNIAQTHPDAKKWVVISTHFALAYGIAAAKEILEKSLGIKIYLTVVVTDASPQRIWAVKDADLIFAPSIDVKNKLQNFLPPDKREIIKAISFPIAVRLSQNLTLSEFQFVVNQLNPSSDQITQIEIPVSGAAVQLDYLQRIIEILSYKNYEFTVIGQESLLTKMFFNKLKTLPRVQVSIGVDAWQTVQYYESLFYQSNRPSIEITKPSEQAFKALLNPRQRGGVILLLTAPIGRQEYDNLSFLESYNFMPPLKENQEMWNAQDLTKWLVKAKDWRAIRIPEDPKFAASFIIKLKSSGIFYAMLKASIPDKADLKTNGVEKIWEEIISLIS